MESPVYCIQDKKQLYCIINPQLCQIQATLLNSQTLTKCKYCKSIQPITNISPCICHICNSVIDLTKHSKAAENIKICPTLSIIKCTDFPDLKPESDLQILLLFEESLGDTFVDGLQCLREVLRKFRGVRAKICCVFYGRSLKVLELCEGGRIIKINYSTFQLINEQFYQITEQALDSLFTYIQNIQPKTSTLNSFKILSDILSELTSRTIILWLTQLTESSNYHPIQTKFFTQIHAFLKIPSVSKTLNISQILLQIQNIATKMYLLPLNKAITLQKQKYQDQLITQQIHYQLYQILDNSAVITYNIETSSQKKYPPYVLTKKNQVLGFLNEVIVVRLGIKIVQDQLIQVRIMYRNIQTDKYTIICVSLNVQDNVINSLREKRYIKLYKSIQNYKITKKITSIKIESEQQRDIYNFINQCSLLQTYEILANIHRLGVVYMVWPWIGFYHKKPVLAYYFTGYYSKFTSKEDKNIEQLKNYNEKYFCKRNWTLPLFYSNLFQWIENDNLYDSDDESVQEEFWNKSQNQSRSIKHEEEIY